MSEFANEAGIWAARITGAVAGAGVSLVYLLPKSKREAASRFITGVSCGMIFGGPSADGADFPSDTSDSAGP